MSRVLVIEDNPDLAFIFEKSMSKHGYKVQIAKDGVEALQRLKFFVPEIIFLDIHMPRLSGLDLLTQLRDNPELAHIPVILMSGDFQTAFAPQAKLADHFVVKPVPFAEILTLTRQYIKNL